MRRLVVVVLLLVLLYIIRVMVITSRGDLEMLKNMAVIGLISLLTGFFVFYLAVSGPVRWGLLVGLLFLNNWMTYRILCHWDEFLHGATSQYQELLFMVVAGAINLVCSGATHLTGWLFWFWLVGELLSSIVVGWLLTKLIVWSYHRVRQVLKLGTR
ncbi:hypothetical protein ABN16_05845 [Levilactobacillus koreensis]|uniref:Uncharacterized protein n=2 Tax=Levilactobacillus koreensis TaxID=637971 RepID=A0AAC8UUA9_9LACO|nr:hypothetical protein ABN16_05845 [Levilactobacillus koreensis]